MRSPLCHAGSFLVATDSAVVVQGFSSCGMQALSLWGCRILAPWPGIKPMSPALEGRFLTSEPLEKSLKIVFLFTISLTFRREEKVQNNETVQDQDDSQVLNWLAWVFFPWHGFYTWPVPCFFFLSPRLAAFLQREHPWFDSPWSVEEKSAPLAWFSSLLIPKKIVPPPTPPTDPMSGLLGWFGTVNVDSGSGVNKRRSNVKFRSLG